MARSTKGRGRTSSSRMDVGEFAIPDGFCGHGRSTMLVRTSAKCKGNKRNNDKEFYLAFKTAQDISRVGLCVPVQLEVESAFPH